MDSSSNLHIVRKITAFFAAALAVMGCNGGSSVFPQVSGHRGANDIAPENTLASADSCIRWGIEVMETDVTMSCDSIFFLLHDRELGRTTNGEGRPEEHTAAYLDSLDAGSWFGPEWAGQCMPRFQTLLRKAKDAGLDITIDYRLGEFADLVALCESEGMLEHTNFTFSDEEDAVRFRKEFPNVHTLQAYVTDINDLDRVMELYSPDIIVNWIDGIDRKFVKTCHDRGLQVLALCLGLDDKTQANRKAVRLGVDVVATDRPKAFKQQFGKL